jgi:isoleucyl-tRNA synthetase
MPLDLPRLEHRILNLWNDSSAFEKRRLLNRGKAPWSFIDGPITANNPMGVHHAWGRTYKDLYQRYQAMQGHELRYQNGFDCQGLWVEVEVEKELGFKSKRDIEAYGIARFVKKCKQRVLTYASKMVEQSIRLGYWTEWDDTELLRDLITRLDHPEEVVTIGGAMGSVTDSVERIVGKLGTPPIGGSYYTFSSENNYTIWSVLKKCHQHGWLYKGRDVMPWCPRCSTALSQHELATEGYQELVHPGVTLKFPLRGKTGESLLVWTTTPWTLTANVAVAVHPDHLYVKVRSDDEDLYLAESAIPRVFTDPPEITGKLEGRQLEGWTYHGPFDELVTATTAGAVASHKVVVWDEVSEEEGTGIVHVAPGCGKEDFELGKKHGLPEVAPLNEYGVFVDGFDWLSGTHVHDSAERIIEALRRKGLLFKLEQYAHRYPVCWRCSSELVFRLVDEWFISMGQNLEKPLAEVTETEKVANLRYQIMESANEVTWIPSYGLQQELDWLRNMDDWMISKKRYWGLALPIWECVACGSFDVIGSEEELQERAVEGWGEFEGHTPHRPWIDLVKIKCSKCGTVSTRIQDVGNPWLDAGIVAYSTLGYRRDRRYWETWFPAHFICESLPGQFRNWFYSMLAMSTILEKRTPFLTCLGHGNVHAEDGREMHKSWGNAIWFDDAVEEMGADAMRWMYCTSKPENDMRFGYTIADKIKKRFFIPLWNIYSFFVTYANIDGWTLKDATPFRSRVDKWVLAKLQILIQAVTRHLDAYDAYDASQCIETFVNELSTWFLRRSRRRFWKNQADEDKRAAYTTLYTCLTTLIRLLAPFTPFIAEELYQNLIVRIKPKALESVHLDTWPEPDASLIDTTLLADMDQVIHVSSLGRAARSKAGIKLRQPIAEAVIVANTEILNGLAGLIELVQDELNVKRLTLTTSKRRLVRNQIRLKRELLGRKHGKLFPALKAAIDVLDGDRLGDRLLKGLNVDVNVKGRTLTLLPGEVEVVAAAKDGYAVAENQAVMVGIMTALTAVLKTEGLARDIVRRIQTQRKAAGFDIADDIETYYQAGPRLRKAFDTHREYITTEILARLLQEAEPPEGSHIEEFEVDGEVLLVGLRRVRPDRDQETDG